MPSGVGLVFGPMPVFTLYQPVHETEEDQSVPSPPHKRSNENGRLREMKPYTSGSLITAPACRHVPPL